MIQVTIDDGDTTSNTDWVPITAEQLAKPSGNILLENIIKKLQSGGHKVFIFSQMVCVIEFLEDLLRVKKCKHKSLNGSKSSSYQAGDVDWFCHMYYQMFVVILKTRARKMGLDLLAVDTNFIFDNYWNPLLRTTLYLLYSQWRQ